LHIALALPETTLILQFSGDLTVVRALDSHETPLDLESRTIRLHNTPGQLVQVTETSITLVKGNLRFVFNPQGENQLLILNSIRESLQDQGISCAEHAACTSEHVVISSLASSGSTLYTYHISSEGITLRNSWQINGEVTCVGTIPRTAKIPDNLVVGTLVEGHPWLSFFTLDGHLISSQAIVPEECKPW
jgi:hypothetical protein